MKNARAKRAKILFFAVKYANLWGFCCRRRRGCFKLPNIGSKSAEFVVGSDFIVTLTHSEGRYGSLGLRGSKLQRNRMFSLWVVKMSRVTLACNSELDLRRATNPSNGRGVANRVSLSPDRTLCYKRRWRQLCRVAAC